MGQLVEAATGVNLWREWARLEAGDLRHTAYTVPESLEGYAGSVVCAAEGAKPDLDLLDAPAIFARFRKNGQVGLIVRAAGTDHVQKLLDDCSTQIERQFQSAISSEQQSPE